MSILHLRDWRHANQFYSNFGHAFSPKVKFLYHVVFVPNDKVPLTFRANTKEFSKEIAMLVNSTDLPAFRVNMENKQQYNRKKNLQTRVDYQDVQMRLWDDNVGSVRAMLQEYYQYYIEDGRHTENDGSFKQRDKYHTGAPSNYGLNTSAHRTNEAFFKYIHIYQMGKNKWNRYTLVNPMLAQWNHGDVAYGEGAGMVEHTLTFAYEAVFFANGTVGDASEPTNFTDPETGYDTTKPEIVSQEVGTPPPGLINPTASVSTSTSPLSQAITGPSTAGIFSQQQPTPNAALPGTEIPNTTSETTVVPPTGSKAPLLSSAAIEAGLSNNPKATTAFLAQAINSGTIVVDTTGVNSYLDYVQLPAAQRNVILSDAVREATTGNQKLAQFASNAIAANPK
jgi:hypothetical protein